MGTRHSRSAGATLVTTTSGVVEGYAHDGLLRWRSIPYGAPPRGAWRFHAPQPAQPWRGVRDCREFSFCAPQQPMFTILGFNRRQAMSEDCLSINVVAPANASEAPLPVMFFIHGGGYAFGTSATALYDGAALVKQGCVYVSANYRLGALGCLDLSSLSTPEHRIESNLFLRDLVAALIWVRDNIAGFGGDPGNVTIFGESAGGHAVTALLAVPSAEGLFHRAISQSPPAGMVRSAAAAEDVARRYMHALGSRRGREAAALMAATPAELGSALETMMKGELREVPGVFGVGATIDGDVLPHDPLEAMTIGKVHQVPLIIGHNAHEAMLFARFMNYLPTSRPTIERLLEQSGYRHQERFASAYPRYPDFRTCVQIGGDVVVGALAWTIPGAHSKHSSTFLYRYDYAPRPLSWAGLGATHATELLAVFDAYRGRLGSMLTLAGDRWSALRISTDIQRRWQAFSRFGVPGKDWPTYTSCKRNVRIFDRRSRMEVDPTPQRRKAWEGFSLAR